MSEREARAVGGDEPPVGSTAELRAAWAERRSLRIEQFLDEAVARELRDAIVDLPYRLDAPPPGMFRYQYSSVTLALEEDCDHATCRFGRWLWSDGLARIAAITGMTLVPPPGRQLVAHLYEQGSYLDPHNDFDGRRKVAFILGLTQQEGAWPASDGGHLEFLAFDEHGARVTERRAPGWNTLDLFDVTGIERIHQVPVITRAVQRRTFAGWFY